MRLLSLVSAAPDPCGVEDFARKLAARFDARPGNDHASLALSGSWSDLHALWKASGEGDVVVMNLPLVAWKRLILSPLLALLLVRLRRGRSIVVLHEWSGLDWRRRLVLAPCLALASQLRACTPRVERELARSPLAPFLGARGDVVPIPANLAKPLELPDTDLSMRLASLRSQGRVIIGQFGSIYPKKRNLVLLEVAAELRSRGLDVVSVFVGSFIKGRDTVEEDFWEAVKELDLVERVIVSGYIEAADEVFAALSQIDVFVYSFEEGLESNRGSVLTALLAGRPVIVNAPRSPHEFDHHPTYQQFLRSDSLRLVPTDTDTAALADAVQPAIRGQLTSAIPEAREMWSNVVDAFAGAIDFTEADGAGRGPDRAPP